MYYDFSLMKFTCILIVIGFCGISQLQRRTQISKYCEWPPGPQVVTDLRRMGSSTRKWGSDSLERISTGAIQVHVPQRQQGPKERSQIFSIMKEVKDNVSLGIWWQEAKIPIKLIWVSALLFKTLNYAIVSITLYQEGFQCMFHARIKDTTLVWHLCLIPK